jgi:ATP-dependent DNA ligase
MTSNEKANKALELLTGKDSVQLVKHFDEVKVKVPLLYPARAEIKYDGVFCAVYVLEGRQTFVSRTGNSLKVPEAAWAGQLADGIWITELICPGLSLEELSGIVSPNRKKKLTAKQEAAMLNAEFIYHDYLTFSQFIRAHDHLGPIYSDRRAIMAHAQSLSNMPMNWRPAMGRDVSGPEQFRAFADDLISRGYEGAVLKPYNADYMPGHKGWRATKIVRGISLDLACIDFELGKVGTKREGLLAKLQFKLPEGGKFWADLGRGWTDERRKELTDRAVVGDLDGVIFKVKALQRSSTGKALRLPKVEEERIDKEAADA